MEAIVNGEAKNGLNSIITLGAWSIWKHRNRLPNVSKILSFAGEELYDWSQVGARGISLLLHQLWFSGIVPASWLSFLCPRCTCLFLEGGGPLRARPFCILM